MDAPLVLPARLTIADLGSLHARLLGVLSGRRELVLDADLVERIDTAGLQLLAVLCRDAAARGIGVRWCAVSTELAANAALLGLSEVLGLAPEVPRAVPCP